MKIRLHPEKLQLNLDGLRFLVDIGMILLVLANLGLILFDWVFQIGFAQTLMQRWAPAFFHFYQDSVHANFTSIDLAFVSVYLTEFVASWAIAAARHTYYRWFFYPFVHWYDLLGCIPVGSFRWLRVLRLVGLAYRLQKRGVVDFSQTAIGQTAIKYYDVLMEEVSDRVVIKVLQGAQREIRTGGQMMQRVEVEVLAPRRGQLVDYVAGRIADIARLSHDQYRDRLSDYLVYVTDEAVKRTSAGRRLAAIPVAGPRAIALLGETVRDTGTAIVDQLVEDIASPANRAELDALVDDLLRATRDGHDVTDSRLNTMIRETLLEILDHVQDQVAIQHWKQDDNDNRGT